MQTRTHSLIESMTNIAVGYGVALISQIVIFHFYGISATLEQNITIGLWFTVISLIRSYCLRRIFTHITEKTQ